jgi:type IV pilus assembly protein PilB
MQDYLPLLTDFLLQANFLTAEQIKNAQEEAKTLNRTFEEILVEKELLKDEELGQIIGDIQGWNYVNLRKEEINEQLLKQVPEEFARGQQLIVLSQNDKGIKVAMNNPDDSPTFHLLQKKLRAPILPYFATRGDLLASFKFYRQEIKNKFDELIQAYAKESVLSSGQDSAIIKITDSLLSYGYEKKASDIHIEPQAEYTSVRFRIDGVMHEIVTLPKKVHDLVIMRMKIMAKLRTDEHQTPQDGKIAFRFQNEPVDIRVSIVPTTKGENAVLRLLAEKTQHFVLEELGLSGKNYTILKNNIQKPWGMILATGPTGSGKTTSLYAILKILNTRDVHIATIEDPVEFNNEGITQIQVNPQAKLTFASGLRSLLRQDPNIVMVGEIRDEETAEIAVNAAMTGHLVLSTLHTNDAPTTLPRLLDMGIEPFLVASTVNVAVAQRLVRKICSRCIQSHETSKDELQGKLPASVIEQLMQGKEKIFLYKGKGCPVCHNTGYAGRLGVFEILEMNDDIRALIMQNASADAIRAKAIEKGMTTMFDDAMDKVRNGLTTVEEMLRVIKY